MATSSTPVPSASDLRARLAKVGQEHLLAFHDTLTAEEQVRLRGQIASIDLESVPGWVAAYVKGKPEPSAPADPAAIKPAPFYPYGKTPGAEGMGAYRAAGEAIIRRGEVGAFVVAGGQGSRLGFEGPKGCYPATAITKKPLFQVFAEQILAANRKYGVTIPWAIMTSPLNHEATVSFFERHRFFGLGRENVLFLQQGVMPSFDMATGKILLAGHGGGGGGGGEVATNPDGHGGAVAALHKSGALAEMTKRGVKHLSYFQVDNPHVKVIDPLFIGLHATAPDSSGEMSSKMVRKASWDEKVGVFCTIDKKDGRGSRLDVIEYSDLPPALAKATGPDGELLINAGSIAIHLMSVAFLERLATDAKVSLPFHRAEKKVPYFDVATGKAVSPAANNGVKLEKFIFDALAVAERSIVVETDRVEEFAPIKNATGADSAESSKALQTQRAARWLAKCGTKVPVNAQGLPDCVIELSPLTAVCEDDAACVRMPAVIAPGESVVL
jgi:UDP-N-acetylglucosamine/UDP-N-acetylgalactosamine diphosphorylase